MSHLRAGSGEPLLLIHGVGSYGRVWEPMLDALAARYEVVAVDLPGFGASPPLPAGTQTDVGALTQAVAGFLDELGWERPHVAGNSLGGWLALELGRRGRARSVVALSPAGFWSPREAAFCRSSLRVSRRFSELTLPLAPLLYGTPVGRTLLMGQLAARPWRMSAEQAVSAIHNFARSPGTLPVLEALTREQFRPGPPIPAPVTIAWGQRDRLLLPRQARRAQRAVPEARVTMLAGVGHVPMSDDPELVARTILSGSA
ncbi:MAG TPA: alpha/beta fold hydrolase [Solirubrobacteraceae bacterium]|nr:alpha/beta fold hydrolase [Solirubrobacteraceae bacterium]